MIKKYSLPSLLLTAALIVAAAPLFAQNPADPPVQNPGEFLSIYQKADPKQNFAFTWKEKGTFTKPAGRLWWEIPPSEFGTGGMDRTFSGYCSEPLVGIIAGHMYRYEIQAPEMPEAFSLPNTEAGRLEAQRRATYVRELFGRFYLGSLNANDPDASVAFQIALWEAIYESEFPPNVAAPFDLFTGNFRANYPALEQSPAYVQRAQQYLQSLTGNDNPFYENPNLPERELVWMKGLTNAATNEIAQSQFGLRARGGGVPGFNGGTAIGGTGIGGVAGFGAGGGIGGVGPGFGLGLGGGGSGGSGGGSSSGGTPTTPATSVTTPPVNGPDTPGGPPTNNGGTPPTTPPDNTTPPGTPTQFSFPPTPVPAPAGVVLGLIAVGLFAGRRAVHKKLVAKN